MLLKIVSLFLIAMVALAIFGRLRFPKITAAKRAKFCQSCGRPRLGTTPCGCDKKA